MASDASLDARTSVALHPTRKKWTVYLPKAYHPLLLQKHQQALQKAMKDVKNANAVSHSLYHMQMQHGMLLDFTSISNAPSYSPSLKYGQIAT